MAEVWLNNQFTRFITRCTKTNVKTVSNVFNSLTKDAVIQQLEEILLKLIWMLLFSAQCSGRCMSSTICFY